MTRIFLIGPRASGKTTLGRCLARRLSLPFADTDALVLQTAGMSVGEIVAAEGWPGFRRRESQALRAAAEACASGVIATGGGMVLDGRNRRFMRETGTVFFLTAPVEILAARLADDPLAAQRPSLTGRDVCAEVAAVLRERKALYEETAHHRLNAALPPEDLCREAVALLDATEARQERSPA